MTVSLGPFKSVGIPAAVLSNWDYVDNGGPSNEDCYKTSAIAYSGSVFTCIELASSDVLDFEAGSWSGPFSTGGNGWITQIVRANNIIYSITYDTGTLEAVYYLTKNGFNTYSRANLCSDAGLSDCTDQTCQKIVCP